MDTSAVIRGSRHPFFSELERRLRDSTRPVPTGLSTEALEELRNFFQSVGVEDDDEDSDEDDDEFDDDYAHRMEKEELARKGRSSS